MEIPNIKTKGEAIREANKNGEELISILARGMFGDIKRLPEYNDADEVARKALKDIKNMDFGSMGDYIDSLVQMVDFWKEKAEHYLECVDEDIYQLDEDGYLETK